MRPIHLFITLLLVAALGFAGFMLTRNPPAITPNPRPAAPIEVIAPAKAEPVTEDNPAPKISADKGGSLKGAVKYDGDPPERRMLTIPPDKQAECHHAANGIPDDSLVVDKATKGIQWAIVRILDVKPKQAFEKPAAPYQLDQKGCMFTPHVIVVPPATELQILNPDGMMHNIHTIPFDSDDRGQNVSQSGADPVYHYKADWMKEPDIIQIQCDIHGWMKGFIVVHDPRYCFVTSPDGRFEIKDIPPGRYKLTIFQEKLGEKNFDIEIKPGEATDLGEIKWAVKKK